MNMHQKQILTIHDKNFKKGNTGFLWERTIIFDNEWRMSKAKAIHYIINRFYKDFICGLAEYFYTPRNEELDEEDPNYEEDYGCSYYYMLYDKSVKNYKKFNKIIKNFNENILIITKMLKTCKEEEQIDEIVENVRTIHLDKNKKGKKIYERSLELYNSKNNVKEKTK